MKLSQKTLKQFFKKRTISLLFTCIVALLFILNACSKIEDGPIQNNPNLDVKSAGDWEIKKHIDCTWYPGFGLVWNCFWPPVRCLPEVEIVADAPTGNKSSIKTDDEVYQLFKTSIDDGTEDEFFTGDYYAQIFPYLDESEFSTFLGILQSDTIRLLEKYNNSESLYLYLAISKDSTTISPLVSSVHLTIQVNYDE